MTFWREKQISRRWVPWAGLLFAVLFFVVDTAELFAGPSVRHGMRHRRQHDLQHSMGSAGAGVCPQMRTTSKAPDEFYDMENPLKPDSINIFAGESLFHTDAQPTACKICHGPTGNGLGMMSQGLNPPPRNFTCAETMKDIPDGQLFWIIKNGSPDTGMPTYKRNLSDEQVWQLIIYLRQFAK